MSSFHANIPALKAQRQSLIAQAQRIMDARPMTKNLSDEFDSLMNQVDNLQAEISRGERVGGMAGREDILISSQASRDRQDPEARAFSNFLKHGLAGLSAEDKSIMNRRFDANFQAAQTTTSGGGGGYAVPNSAMAPLVEALKLSTGVLPYCTILQSDSGSDLPVPADNETSILGEIVNEGVSATEQDATFTSVTLNAFLYSSKIMRVSLQLLDDSSFDFSAFVMRACGQRIGRAMAQHLITGTGANQPRGIAVAAPVGKTAASATAVTYDELLDLQHSVDPLYRANGTWVFNDLTYAALRKLKDTQSRPLFGDLASSSPMTLLGRPIAIDPNMPSMATGNKAILFGDLSLYYVRLVRDMRLMRLAERYAEFHQVGFLAFLRADADLIDAGTGPVKALAMA